MGVGVNQRVGLYLINFTKLPLDCRFYLSHKATKILLNTHGSLNPPGLNQISKFTKTVGSRLISRKI